jgi:hypothetical protein
LARTKEKKNKNERRTARIMGNIFNVKEGSDRDIIVRGEIGNVGVGDGIIM